MYINYVFVNAFKMYNLLQDFRPAEVYTIEYLIDDNTNLDFVVADGESNLALFMYQPESRKSLGGQKLIRKADFHLGQKINTFFRIKCRITDPANDKKQFSGADNIKDTSLCMVGFKYFKNSDL